MILITGATGTVASELVRELSSSAVRVRAMVHYAHKAPLIGQPGVEIVEASYERPDSLDRAMEGIERVFLVAPPSPDQVEQETHVIEAAARAGVKHIVKQSILHAGPDSPVPMESWNGRVEEILIDSGVPYTILQPNAFMQIFLGFAPQIVNDRVVLSPIGEARVSMIDARDVATVAAEILVFGGHLGERHVLTGPHAISFEDVAQRLSRALDREIRYHPMSSDETRELLVRMGTPDWYVKADLKLAEEYRLGGAAEVTNDVEEITGHPACTFDRFAEDYKGALLQAARGEQREAA
jgi:uncharacterized protein YbjT (DUF2867 family)